MTISSAGAIPPTATEFGRRASDLRVAAPPRDGSAIPSEAASFSCAARQRQQKRAEAPPPPFRSRDLDQSGGEAPLQVVVLGLNALGQTIAELAEEAALVVYLALP